MRNETSNWPDELFLPSHGRECAVRLLYLPILAKHIQPTVKLGIMSSQLILGLSHTSYDVYSVLILVLSVPSREPGAGGLLM